jgi:hypothetical protein
VNYWRKLFWKVNHVEVNIFLEEYVVCTNIWGPGGTSRVSCRGTAFGYFLREEGCFFLSVDIGVGSGPHFSNQFYANKRMSSFVKRGLDIWAMWSQIWEWLLITKTWRVFYLFFWRKNWFGKLLNPSLNCWREDFYLNQDVEVAFRRLR